MFSLIIKNVAVKYICTVTFAVTLITAGAIFFVIRYNKVHFIASSYESIENAVYLAETVYLYAVSEKNFSQLNKINQIILHYDYIIAVNVYNDEGFINGLKKQTSSEKQKKSISDFIDLTSPFSVFPEMNNINKRSGLITDNGVNIGRFEIFYKNKSTDQSINILLKQLFIILYVLDFIFIIISSFIFIHFTRPIVESIHIIQEKNTTETSTYIKRKTQRDEIGIVFNWIVDTFYKIKEFNNKNTEYENSRQHFREIFAILQKAITNKEYSIRMLPSSKDDDIVFSLNTMLDALESADKTARDQSWLKNGQAELSSIIGGEHNIESLSGKALTFIATYIDALVGTLFILDYNTNTFFLAAQYALLEGNTFSDKFEPGEGLPGQAALQKKTMIFDQVPKDYIWIESSLGRKAPRSIISLPLIYEDSVKGVIELGSWNTFTDIQIEFLESVSDTIAVAINASLMQPFFVIDAEDNA